MTSNSNKVALVTGGSRGLGRDMALQLARNDFDVIITYNSNKEAATQVVEEVTKIGRNSIALQLDVAKASGYTSFARLVQEKLASNFSTDKLQALVNNAGTGLYAPFDSTTEEQFDDMVNIHLKAAFFLTQKMLPNLSDGGSIINISSGLARFSNPQLFCLCYHEGCYRKFDPIPGTGIGQKENKSQYRSTGCYRNRLCRWLCKR
jgi:NAD(P)-dependent dehydrogenase (short-subunit alcohol dehydrogenase family)